MRCLLAAFLATGCVVSGAAYAQAPGQIPGTLPPAPTYTPLPPAAPPSPVPSVVTPSPPLPGVTFPTAPVLPPGGGSIAPSYRLPADEEGIDTRPVAWCGKRGHRYRCHPVKNM